MKIYGLFLEGFPSGQRDQTVNLTRKLRWFESTSLHQLENEAILSSRAVQMFGR
jgi:hypothetical protein